MTESPFLLLPPELRLQIYSYILDIPAPTPYTALTRSKSPLIVITDTGNKYTTRGIYRALHISPEWVVNNTKTEKEKGKSERGEKLSLLSVNHQIHAEAEHFLYTSHTLFFLNGFELDYLDEFLDSLSPTARRCIRSIGFEVYLFVHGHGHNFPKRTFRQYEHAAQVVREKLPGLKSVLFYLDPWFAETACDEKVLGWRGQGSVLSRGAGFLVRAFGSSNGQGEDMVKMDFLPGSVNVPSLGTGISQSPVVRVS